MARADCDPPMPAAGVFVVGTSCLHECHGDAPAPGPAEGAVRDASRSPSPKWAGAVEQGRQIARAGLTEQNLPGLSVAVGVGGEIVWAEGFGWADLEKRVPVAPGMRFRIGGASMALTSAAVGLLLEKDRLNLDDEIQTYVPAFPEKQWPVTLRQLMGHVAGVRNDGGDEEPLSERCERTTDGLKRLRRSAAVRAGHPVQVFDLRLDPGERGGRSRGGRAVLHVHAHADLQAAGHDRHDARLGDGADPGSGDLLLPEIRGRSPATARSRRARATIPASRAPARSCPRRPTWCASGWRSTAASCCNPPPSGCSRRHSSWPRARRPVTALAGISRPVSARGRTDAMVGHDGEFLIGGSTSFMTFPERGLVVAVTTNTRTRTRRLLR